MSSQDGYIDQLETQLQILKDKVRRRNKQLRTLRREMDKLEARLQLMEELTQVSLPVSRSSTCR